MNWLGLDIGGANIKLADGRGYAVSRAFALWQTPELLEQELRTAISEAPPSDRLIVAMTGELADCFDTKTEGVEHILTAVEGAADGRHTRVFLTSGKMVTPQAARSNPLSAAAANWRALTTYVGRCAPIGPSLAVDVGSTTCDLVALRHGDPAPHGLTDTDRLVCGELVYTGIERSPVCAVLKETVYRGKKCPVAQEFFATTRDAYLLLGVLPESTGDLRTADHRPATKAAARRRLGRMVCADDSQFNHRDAAVIAQAVMQTQVDALVAAARQVISGMPKPPETIILSGHGEFLARKALEKLELPVRYVSLTRELGWLVSRCATAHALAVLAGEGGNA
ncbi:hydantoinase/oxoprolinase family protein [Lignipirellula cremea]|uniref:Hydantoinase/oxoprolinase n=1 Tax=Lignipirellula cremea TaxID=2528010 RepID=A0A518DWC2_9BACT|nr:hydantoinase/oxoprolinase family protein [Lignipirellula cremea]QDU96129.1 Hydantoinase/oxoprolinase [Lignipirellula cremea]